MKIHKEGRRIILIVVLTLVGVLLLIHFLIKPPVALLYILYSALLLIAVFTVFFFRIPVRKAIVDESKVISGADGVVVAIEEVIEKEYFRDKRVMVSVFMSVFNIHTNFIPVSGKLIYFRHHHGKHFFAWEPKASTQNEHTTLVIETENHGPILVRQVAGAFARRIVCNHTQGSVLKQGEELGIIKFGSRVDIYLPLSAKVYATLHQRVRGGQTVLAVF
ncbi:MAG: phosphatidylserine decarboxylase family protein [Bacteroidales bacterium]|nr:phosphatidylserine decarboxylase family protein [Bacteroidales bacterium]